MKKLIAAIAAASMLFTGGFSEANEARNFPANAFDALRSAVLPEGLRMTSALYAGGVLEVCLEGKGDTAVERTRLAAENMLELLPADSVNVILNGRYLTNYGRFNDETVLYFPEPSGKFVVPESEVLWSEGDVSELLEALNKAGSGNTLAAIPGDISGTGITYSFEEDGRRSIRLDFPMGVFTALEASEETRWQFLACTALTLLSNLSDIDCVRISFAGQSVSGVPDRDGMLMRIPDGCIDRACFAGYTGTRAAEGCYVGAADSLNPAALLAAAMPGAVAASDVTGWSFTDGIMDISLSRRFYRSCADFTPEDERDTVYGIVNTLCRAMGARRVRILIEGEGVSTLSGSICLEGALMPSAY